MRLANDLVLSTSSSRGDYAASRLLNVNYKHPALPDQRMLPDSGREIMVRI